MQKGDVARELAYGSPPVAYVSATFAGMSLPDWAALLAIVYTACLLVQMGYRLRGWVREQRHKIARGE